MDRLQAAASRDEAIDDLLARWHWWQGRSRVGRGFNNRSAVAGEYAISRQYDDDNGALDDDLENLTMRQVDFEVRELSDPWRSALHALAMSLCTGAAVIHSPRIMPADRERVTAEARVRIARRLVVAGVI
jgi:hypothetical protein